MRPRLRDISAAACTGSSLSLASVRSTASAPAPSVSSVTAPTTSRPSFAVTPIAPKRSASATRDASRSMPITRQPLARASCTVRRPISPRPYTTTHSPSVGAARRTPCKPIAASGVNAALSNGTPSGMRAASVCVTRTYSACGPLVTTRSPTAKPSTRGPTSATIPAWQ